MGIWLNFPPQVRANKILETQLLFIILYRGVEQFGSSLGSYPKGRGFKSRLRNPENVNSVSKNTR